ncbi:MAG TPA: hypothetical protein VNG53_12070 [Bacteroidia bacterium]|nr:hypothetical protein [Bacteroidia bacterium]
MNKKLFLIGIFVLSTFVFSCNKKQDQVPLTGVNIYITLAEPAYANLNAVTGWVYISGGVRGIIIYRASSSAFMAYDRDCPYQPNNTCALVKVDSTNNITAFDPCCGSKFLLTDGSVMQGPATAPLKQYETSFDGFTLHIFN